MAKNWIKNICKNCPARGIKGKTVCMWIHENEEEQCPVIEYEYKKLEQEWIDKNSIKKGGK